MILELSLSLALAFGPGAGYTLDLDARAVIEAPWTLPLPGAPRAACGISYAHVAFVRPCTWIEHSDGRISWNREQAREHVTRHEAAHLEQHSAIGPVQVALSALAPGVIEDYLPGATWYPRESEIGTCPLLRLEGSSPDRLDRLRVMPCYPSILGIRLPAP